MDYLTYALLILALGACHIAALYGWIKYKRLYNEKCASIDAQAWVIKQNNVQIVAQNELVDVLRHRLELKDVEDDILDAKIITER